MKKLIARINHLPMILSRINDFSMKFKNIKCSILEEIYLRKQFKSLKNALTYKNMFAEKQKKQVHN